MPKENNTDLSTSSHSVEDRGAIEIIGDRVNNLKGISVSIPRQKLTVVTGVSGSGKSSLAFDTLYAEGQRRYVDSLSSYTRQFMDRMPKPECDNILYIPPAIAIRQRTISRNPRSTVGTSTEIYDYLKILFSRFGRTISPTTGREVKRHTIEDVIKEVLSVSPGERIMLLSPIRILNDKRTLSDQLSLYLSAGYLRVIYNNKTELIEELLVNHPKNASDCFLIIDRLEVVPSDKEFISRLADSIELAFYEGHGHMMLRRSDGSLLSFSNRYEENGVEFEEPSTDLFDFNCPSGACPECQGFGKTVGIAEDLVIPSPYLSVYEDAVACWIGPKSALWKDDFIRKSVRYHFPIHLPYNQLTTEQKKLLWQGDTTYCHKKSGNAGGYDPNRLYGIDDYFSMMRKEYYKIQNRVRLAHFSGKTTCPLCRGDRLKANALYVQYHGKNISELTSMSIADALSFFDQLLLSPEEAKYSENVRLEITTRLSVLCDMGLGYLTLDRLSNTLSGGESQRINISARLGSNLYGTLYVLDEPSIGLHERDSIRLLSIMQRLRDAGNTIVVVEHDETVIRAADHLIDIGPDAGYRGGEVVYEGSPDCIDNNTSGYTAAYLRGDLTIAIPSYRRPCNSYIEVKNATTNNLKNITVRFPLNAITVVTGVSGSGKSTLVRNCLFEALSRYIDNPLNLDKIRNLSGDLKRIKAVEFVDQFSLGRSSRSNPVTYTGMYDAIRMLYSEQPLAKQLGFTPKHFSFNVPGGRCETCKGEGTITIEMQFMADIELTCEECQGKRFRKDLLEIEYAGANVYDLLEMTVDRAHIFFSDHPSKKYTDTILNQLQSLRKVGLGYVKLGQTTSSLSGGEVQRLKLAKHLSVPHPEPTFFIFDEPTTGLHFHDINTLLKAFNELIDMGHSLVIIEHNLDIIKNADYIIDLGPEGGDKGGYLMATGTPEEICTSTDSITAVYLRNKLNDA